MTRYTSHPFPFTLIITFIFFTVITSAAVINSPCKIEGHVEFFPDFNKDYLSGVITFSENKGGDKVIVDGIFTTDIGVDGIKDEDGNPRYRAELYNNKGVLLYDLTDSVFNNAIELVSFNKQYANLQICGSNSIIDKVVVIKKDGDEIARAEIYELLDYH
ncbi:hypothetical protein RhiirA5_357567 [Rhizophagus irregularis]|uniref:Uncharacterized protein n=3 Tax=Rhizophagus irregularis TaxID=588596 RepID=A0A2I1DY71_9GLOM|nr:hypothetical protein GLOIN_2v1503450 [Rhizophagus irregularis DAOM 181602=DAOM 197198]EXX59090.1 hypothetical protein RirG_192030 [Rhizophagus irregularis DAOM 197198w]PKC08711.1 hypothetical protein RhiirA5_357567 [Rhizophagus irregularis]PKC68141.1 hypothetical protein RhiirA1_417191 [Rhizophagus irregularis]PKK67107.1 hypothetical protein RhiirC2_752282 [Rhizophagus irregularis]PKY14813.1 hypothetical protein RhiirB3_400767 [Rhizophagus irregularis]|eukprot:XP_025188763.1 hypothetical protein GLOIN_2v1503450 [Rhizophagus irregularis DAOM 181602=DAOM 197198]